jgi:hypothetical protein
MASAICDFGHEVIELLMDHVSKGSFSSSLQKNKTNLSRFYGCHSRRHVRRCRAVRIALVFLALPWLFLFPSSGCWTQVPDPVMAAEAPVPGSGHDYIGVATETVNPADGSVTFDLPLGLPKGRELSLPLAIHYSSGSDYFISAYNGISTFPALNLIPVQHVGDFPPFLTLPFLSFQGAIKSAVYQAGGQGETATYHQCDWTTHFVFRGLDGVQYPLGQVGASWPDDWSANPPNPGDCVYTPPGGGTFHGILVTPGTQDPNQEVGQPAMTITDQSGTVYQFAAQPIGSISSFAPFALSYGLLPQTITDRNGNQLTFTGNGYKDTLGNL